MDIAVFAGAAVVATGALALRRVAAHTEAADVAEVAPGCFTKSKAAYVDKRSRIVGGGMSMLQVVADFDRTLTKNMVNGKQGFSAYRALESCEMREYELRAMPRCWKRVRQLQGTPLTRLHWLSGQNSVTYVPCRHPRLTRQVLSH